MRQHFMLSTQPKNKPTHQHSGWTKQEKQILPVLACLTSVPATQASQYLQRYRVVPRLLASRLVSWHADVARVWACQADAVDLTETENRQYSFMSTRYIAGYFGEVSIEQIIAKSSTIKNQNLQRKSHNIDHKKLGKNEQKCKKNKPYKIQHDKPSMDMPTSVYPILTSS